MTDHPVGLPGVPAAGVLPAEIVGHSLGRYKLRPAIAWPLAALIWASIVAYAWQEEGQSANILFMLGVTAALAALLTLLSHRALFATVLVGSLVVLIVAAASAKRDAMNMVVHAYDLFFYLGSWSTISYLWTQQQPYVLGAATYLLAAAAAASLAYHLDGTRVQRRRSAAAFAIFAALACYGALTKGERRHMQFYFSNLYVSSFYA